MEKILAMSDMHPRDRLAYWYDVACKVFVKHECRIEKATTLDATIYSGALGQLGLLDVRSHGLKYTAVSARDIANEEDNCFFLGVQIEGSVTALQDGREAELLPGDFALIDSQRPYASCYSSKWRQLFIKIPHRALKARLTPSSQLTARTVQHSDGLGGLVSEYIRLLPSRIATLQPMEKARIAEHVLDLVALSLMAEGDKDRPALSSARAVALLRLRTAVEARLSDPSLDPSAAAAAAGISVRYANALLKAEDSSLERLIVSRRLERCRRALEDPAQAHRAVGEIAYAWGFSDLSHFTRRFKAAFGSAPRDYRAAHQA